MSACVECGRETDRRRCERCYTTHRRFLNSLPTPAPRAPIAPTADAYLNEKVLARCVWCKQLTEFPKWRIAHTEVTCRSCEFPEIL